MPRKVFIELIELIMSAYSFVDNILNLLKSVISEFTVLWHADVTYSKCKGDRIGGFRDFCLHKNVLFCFIS